MSSPSDRERDRAQRHRLIVAAARELAMSEGWEAVTTRRLAQAIGYTQPVLYSHFRGKRAIVAAVALDGFGELAARVHDARQASDRGRAPQLLAACRAYLEFASARPALYQAMFVLPSDLRFASTETPLPLRDAFDELSSCFEDDERRDLLAEITWSALHGMVVLADGGRVARKDQDERLEFLVSLVLAGRVS